MLIETETIMIVDDHPIVVDGLGLMLQSLRPNAIFIKAENGKEMLKLIETNKNIDWIFLDVNLPDFSGVTLLSKLKKLKLLSNIIILSSDINPGILEDVIRLKVNGVLSKSFNQEILKNCLTQIEQGKTFLTAAHHRDLSYYRQSILLEKEHIKDNISKRQIETLLMISKGYSNKEISLSMGVAESTVKFHVSSLMELFDADNRTHCVSEAVRLKVI